MSVSLLLLIIGWGRGAKSVHLEAGVVMSVSLLLLNECSYVFAAVLVDPCAVKRQLLLNTRRADNRRRPISREPGEISTSRSAGDYDGWLPCTGARPLPAPCLFLLTSRLVFGAFAELRARRRGFSHDPCCRRTISVVVPWATVTLPVGNGVHWQPRPATVTVVRCHHWWHCGTVQ